MVIHYEAGGIIYKYPHLDRIVPPSILGCSNRSQWCGHRWSCSGSHISGDSRSHMFLQGTLRRKQKSNVALQPWNLGQGCLLPYDVVCLEASHFRGSLFRQTYTRVPQSWPAFPESWWDSQARRYRAGDWALTAPDTFSFYVPTSQMGMYSP